MNRKDLIAISDWNAEELADVIDLAIEVKRNPAAYRNAMQRKTLIMIFEKPSLRTRVSFETAMTQMGGHAIYYDMGTSPLGAGKENVADTARVLSRYVDIIMARLFDHRMIVELARHATIPVINGLTNHSHPTQILADLVTIMEHKGKLRGLKLAYLGDSNNNVTHSLLAGCSKLGIHISIGCPPGDEYMPEANVLKKAVAAGRKSRAKVVVTHDPAQAVRNADVVYTDSWMSYHIPQEKQDERVRLFQPYQVNRKLMKLAASDAIFMNCLPALRGFEQTADVIDGPRSVVFDEAENRLHAHKAIMLALVKKSEW